MWWTIASRSVGAYCGGRASRRADLAAQQSVAVLPFENATGDPGNEYLSDGISESLINKLSSLPGLRVISRTSAMQYRDSTKPLPASKFRPDITVIGVPLTAICNREYTDPRQRQLFKNIIYIGVLTALIDMDVAAVEKLIGEQYKGKDKLIAPNIKALHIGRDYATLNLACPIGLRLKKSDKVGDRIFIDGNSAAALGCVSTVATGRRMKGREGLMAAASPERWARWPNRRRPPRRNCRR